MRKITIYTVQMAQHRLVKKKGLELLDITVKSGDPRLAPTWDMLKAYKSSKMTKSAEEIYTEDYIEKLSKLHRDSPEVLHGLLAREHLVLACYCPPNTFCHRHLLKDILIKIADQIGVEVIDGGEITKD